MSKENPPIKKLTAREVHPEETGFLSKEELHEADLRMGEIKAELYPLVKRAPDQLPAHYHTRIQEEFVEPNAEQQIARVRENLDNQRNANAGPRNIEPRVDRPYWHEVPRPAGPENAGGANNNRGGNAGNSFTAAKKWFNKRTIMQQAGLVAAGSVGVGGAIFGAGALLGLGAAPTAVVAAGALGINLAWLSVIGGPLATMLAFGLLESGVLSYFWNLGKKQIAGFAGGGGGGSRPRRTSSGGGGGHGGH